MMRIEIRNDAVLIDGYVNAVERDSKVLCDRNGKFIERIKAGAFQRALERAKRSGYDVKVLLNHDYSKELTSTKDESTQIIEDNIGLRCTCEIRNAEAVEKAKAGKFSGWSFGFIALKEDVKAADDEIKHRDVRELELREISILDDTKIPAYDGTSIETRAETFEDFIEIRMTNDEVQVKDESSKYKEPFNNHEWHNRYMAIRANL